MSSVAVSRSVSVSVLEDFEDGPLDRKLWDRLLAPSTASVFLTFDWQREWWRAFGSDDEQLLLVLAERDGEPCAIAPLFAANDMLFLVGSRGSDYLDFIGQLDEQLLTSLLDGALRTLGDFAGIGLYHVPRRSRTTSLLPAVAERLRLGLYSEGELSAPYADLTDSTRVRRLTARRGLRKAESRMRREGPLLAREATSGELDEWLELLFAQRAAVWSGGQSWLGSEARSFCHAIVDTGHRAGWLRFAMLEWQGHPAAFEISLAREHGYLSYLGSGDRSIERFSPAAVLQAHSVSAALQSGARRWDFGLGAQPRKLRDASGVVEVANWFLCPE
jgi:CelD/BcsL family acetyltransferase involved in cellulose biosynthesis